MGANLNILQFAGLKEPFHEASHDREPSIDPKIIQTSGEPDILFGSYNSLNSDQVLAAIPPKDVADRLVAEYFFHRAIAPGTFTSIKSLW